ncbi:PRC-barrel domain-containing protein [Caballeronia sordidicola]|uniref:PRC-barrel domain-containing protein n=1 Tax=Caballeronia sordidicola TaxID=196367 RepID=UPI000A3B7383|nr:PRC-barrel domain-containing protein [Caballeronia sordidicola]
MLRSIQTLKGSAVAALDGLLGSVDEVYFDDQAWGVRYLVIDTGNWLNGRQVLISPYSVKHTDPGAGAVSVDLTRDQVRDSPSINTQQPVSRQHEVKYLRYYGYPMYWGGRDSWGIGGFPVLGPMQVAPGIESEAFEPIELAVDGAPPVDVHLRSTDAVTGYHIEARDGSIGHVSGFIFDDVAWVIRYLTVDTRNWWPGGKTVLLATQWVGSVDWLGSTISTGLTRGSIRSCPDYDDSVPLSRTYEAALHTFHGKDGYWAKGDTSLPRQDVSQVPL